MGKKSQEFSLLNKMGNHEYPSDYSFKFVAPVRTGAHRTAPHQGFLSFLAHRNASHRGF